MSIYHNGKTAINNSGIVLNHPKDVQYLKISQS